MASFRRRVVLTGSESTGKTTLAEPLARHYRTVWVPEFSRGYAEGKAEPLTADDVEPIARGQLRLELQALELGGDPVFFDTDLLSTLVYARHYYSQSPRWIEDHLRAPHRRLYLLCETDVDWVADPVRDRGDEREAMQSLFRATLEEFGLLYRPVSGHGPVRLERAVAAIDGWLAG